MPTNEIMIVNPIVKKLIADGEDGKLGDAIRMCHQEGMQDFTESLRRLVQRERHRQGNRPGSLRRTPTS